jgi:hypothetical protein
LRWGARLLLARDIDEAAKGTSSNFPALGQRQLKDCPITDTAWNFLRKPNRRRAGRAERNGETLVPCRPEANIDQILLHQRIRLIDSCITIRAVRIFAADMRIEYGEPIPTVSIVTTNFQERIPTSYDDLSRTGRIALRKCRYEREGHQQIEENEKNCADHEPLNSMLRHVSSPINSPSPREAERQMLPPSSICFGSKLHIESKDLMHGAVFHAGQLAFDDAERFDVQGKCRLRGFRAFAQAGIARHHRDEGFQTLVRNWTSASGQGLA